MQFQLSSKFQEEYKRTKVKIRQRKCHNQTKLIDEIERKKNYVGHFV
jgi:hypothetical protein